MSGLFPALAALLLLHLTDRPPMLAARLGERFGNVLSVLAGLALAHGLAAGLAAVFAGAVQPAMPAEARRLLTGIALIVAGIVGLVPMRRLDALAQWRTGPFVTALLGGFNLIWGDRAYFLLFALAVAAPMPWTAAVGGWIGAMGAAFVAMAMGEAAWDRLPRRWLRPAIALAALIPGTILTATALSR
jgi:putative Ca2+/H+ antiporter (TMEM165/GDT1 family)